MSRSDSYIGFSTCSFEIETNLLGFAPNDPKRLDFRLSPPSTPNGFWHSFILLGDSLRAADLQFPPIQTVDLFVRKYFPESRRKRAVDTIPVYFKRYNHVFFTPEYGNVTFYLDPPIPQDSTISFDVEIVFIDPQVNLDSLASAGQSIESVAQLAACPLTQLPPSVGDKGLRRKRQGAENCSLLYDDLTGLNAAVTNTECGFIDRRYRVLQLCLKEATAGECVDCELISL